MTTKITIPIVLIAVISMLACFPLGNYVFAAWNPQAQTNSATNIQDSSVMLSGNLYDLGGDYSATVWFQYGTTTSYGYETIHINQNYTGYVSQSVYGLMPNTTYHFRVVAQNSFTTSYGQDVVFTTTGSSYNFYAQTNASTATYNNQATLHGYVSGGTYATNAWFQYGTSTSYGNTSANQQINYSGSVSQVINNLVQNTTYHYRLVAQSNNGQTVFGQDMTFSTGTGYSGQSDQASILEGIRQIIILLQQILARL